ncbi:DEAD-domain-containing protein [Tothia fuscella]|uniref:RNA helicase n=1 Tax=Tothia fuscella TaxID=1048955 RepID=A0A9P4TXZ4_9PEZI|nr:DEAD-domain-containing protein [Tothia fuscella]
MAPILEDDFILTLSDNDEPLPNSEDESPHPSPKPALKKRKREQADAASKPTTKKPKNKHATGVNSTDVVEPVEPDVTWAEQGEDDGALASDFEFQVGETTGVIEDFDGWEGGAAKNAGQKTGNGTGRGVDIEEIIARRKAEKGGEVDGESREEVESEEDKEGDFEEFDDEDDELLEGDAFGMGGEDEENESEEEEEFAASEAEDGDSDAASDDDSVAAPVVHPDDIASASEIDEDEDDAAEAERRTAFFAPEEKVDLLKPPKGTGSFQTMSLSRPILKGLAAVGFSEPTPIQAKTIPVALLGKDVVGGAVTGSGKTAAFIIPILERLLYRPKKVPTTRVAILMPTRELAVQCFNVSQKLASFTDVTFAQIVGGFSLREQENTLRSRPDVIIATPGRFIDHMRNSPSFAVDTLEILVLDEADRMLEDGFADELNEILTTIPKSRQTMLFSATMTSTVDKLIRVGLNRPVRLMVDAKKQTVTGLVQEFVRLRHGREDKRLACLLYLCRNVYTDRAIIFFRQKKEAHRVRVVFALSGLKAAELHGSMSQEQRINAVESFRSSTVSFLLATDLASRGLDIKNVETVINYEAPQSHEIYLHRVGRTARAGRTGRSCTIAAETDRKVVKAAVKSARAQGAKVVSRVLPIDEIDTWDAKIRDMDDEIHAVLKDEKEEKLLTVAERDLKRGENLVVHEDEIKGRPRRTWFESEKEKKGAKEAGKRELNGDILAKEKKGKLSNKDRKKLDIRDERVEGRAWKKGKGDGKGGKPFVVGGKPNVDAAKGGKVGKGKSGGGGGKGGPKKSKNGDSMPRRGRKK